MLITGGAGFIGCNLAHEAIRRGLDVTVLDDLSTGYRDNLTDLDVKFIEGSLLDHEAVESAVNGADAIVHLAALGSVPRSIRDPLASHAANATGTLLLLEAARRAETPYLVGASSSSVYGLNPALPKHEREWVRPMSPYAVTKLATEQYLLAYQQSFGMQTLAFRFFNVYGPRQRAGHAYAAVIPIFIDALLSGQPLPVNGDGTQSRDFTYVGTVCRVLLDAVERSVGAPEPVNLAFGSNTTVLELLERLEERTGLRAEVRHMPPRPGDVPHSQAANSSLRTLFPSVEPVFLDEGLDHTIRWFRSL